MTVQTDAGPDNPVALGKGDFIRTDRGVTWGIKCVNLSGTQWVGVYSKDSLGKWQWEVHLDDGFETTTGVTMFGSVLEWFQQRMIPNLNKWLAVKFPAVTDTAPLPPSPSPTSKIEEADLLINTRLQISMRNDGTLVATLKP